MTVNTAKVVGRRKLRFNSVDDILAEAEQLSRGKVRCLGNWSVGQIMDHLAKSVHITIDGVDYKAPILIRIICRAMKRSFLNSTMRAGFQLPKLLQSRFLPDDKISTEEGLRRLRDAINRFHQDPKRAPNSVLGELTPLEHEQLQCRHAELHMSFLVPDSVPTDVQ